MRAVNLIPSEQQRGAGGAAGRSGGGAYVLLGALALLVVLAATYVVSNKSVTDKRTQLADVTQQADAAEAQAQKLTSYTKFAAIRQKRVDTVTQLAGSRFDWAHALREVARVLPQNAWLTELTGTTSSAVSIGSGSSTLRGALNVPALVISGCTTSQQAVAKLITRLRLIDGVQRVTLEDASKGDQSATTTGGGDSAGGSDCRGGHAKFPIFNADIFFEQSGPAVSTSTGTAATASATTAASSASPSSTTTPSTTASSTAPASGTTGGASQ